MMKIKKGDTVKIMAGKDRGRTGKVLHALPAAQKVVIEALNVVKKRARPKRQGEKGETVLVPRPLSVSNIMLVCSNCKNPTRVGSREISGGRRERYCKKCQATI